MSDFVNYSAVMKAIEVEARAIFSQRVFSRTWKDFALWSQEQLERGVVSLYSGGIADYPYEQGSTECGRHKIYILCQGVLPKAEDDGELIENAEFRFIRQLEKLAVRCEPIELLAGLKLQRCTQSMQVEAPYYWVASEWQNYVEGLEDE